MLKAHLTQSEITQRNALLGPSCERLGVSDPQPLPRGSQNISETRVLLLFTYRKGVDFLRPDIPNVLLACLLRARKKLNRDFKDLKL
jgi:hypothetical protein